ncbi:hypothetical protein D3C87_1907270 [compost metagenome]
MQGLDDLGGGLCGGGPFEFDMADLGAALLADEIVLEVQLTDIGVDPGAYLIIGHCQNLGQDTQT